MARAQWGVFSRAQAATAGLGAGAMSRRTGSGSWVAVFPGVYRAASTPDSWHQRLMAACLWAGDGAAISHRTAARLLGLEGVAAARRHDPIELTVPLGKTGRALGLLVHRSRRMDRVDRSAVNGIPVTSLARTLIDISPMLDEKHLSMALDSGLARHPSIDILMLRRALRRLKTKGRAGTHALQRVLQARAPDALHLDSALERRFAAALRSAGLPRPVEHHDVVDGGRHVAELDFAYPRQRVGIQVNGASIHRRHAVWERDQDQLSDLAALGWRIVHVTASQLENKEAAILQRVARALEHDDS